MKYLLLLFFLFTGILSMAQGQTKTPSENVVITSTKNKTLVSSNENGELQVNVSPDDVIKFKANGLVRYSDFGARGDGKTDDMDAIAAAHAVANQYAFRVKADEGATYYIGGKNRTAVIRTDTDFGTAAFIIDDTDVKNRNSNVFLVNSNLRPFKPEGITSLKRNQGKIDISLPGTCLITVTNSNVRRYIRFGPNQNNGSQQTDIFIVDKNGKVDLDAPIIWDFDQITDITALPIDETTLTITGGRFTTIANYCKNLVYDKCTFSRFDAHMGVANATIRNSTLGHQGINAIGSGTFTVENSTIYSRNLINLRSDYGSTWQGEFIIRNCVFVPSDGRSKGANLIGGSYSGQHDFGYTCYMPQRITIENLRIDDSKHSEEYQGPAIFANFNPQMTNDSYLEKFPYVRTREVILMKVTIVSGKALRISDNPYMFKDVKVNIDQ